MTQLQGDEVFAMLCREHDRETGGDKVFPGQDWRDPDGAIWRIAAIATHGGERTALLTDSAGDVLHLPASLVARRWRLVDPDPASTPDARGRDG